MLVDMFFDNRKNPTCCVKSVVDPKILIGGSWCFYVLNVEWNVTNIQSPSRMQRSGKRGRA
jgi:hypothetical protein